MAAPEAPALALGKEKPAKRTQEAPSGGSKKKKQRLQKNGSFEAKGQDGKSSNGATAEPGPAVAAVSSQPGPPGAAPAPLKTKSEDANQVTKAPRKDTSRNRCRWTEDEDGQLVRLVLDDDYRAALCGVRKLRWDLIARVLGRWSADGHTVRHRYTQLEYWDGTNAPKSPKPRAAAEPAGAPEQPAAAAAGTAAAPGVANKPPVKARAPKDGAPAGSGSADVPSAPAAAAEAEGGEKKKSRRRSIPYKLLVASVLLTQEGNEGSAAEIEEAVEGNSEFAPVLAAAEEEPAAAAAGASHVKRSKLQNGVRSALSGSGGLFARVEGKKTAAGHAVYRLDAAMGAAQIKAWNRSCATHPGRQPLPVRSG